MAEYWVVNGHESNCAYLRSLRYFDDPEQECDCEPDDDDESFWDEDEEVWS